MNDIYSEADTISWGLNEMFSKRGGKNTFFQPHAFKGVELTHSSSQSQFIFIALHFLKIEMQNRVL